MYVGKRADPNQTSCRERRTLDRNDKFILSALTGWYNRKTIRAPDSDTLKLTAPAATPIEVTVQIEETNMTMEVDTGAAVSIISETSLLDIRFF